MRFEKEDISSKDELLAMVLAIFFGSYGLHRFYVGKYVSGTVYLLLCNTRILFNILVRLGLDTFRSSFFDYFATGLALVLIAYDIYALYSESFTDGKKKLIVGKGTKEECGIIDHNPTRIDNAIIVFCLFLIYVIVRYIIIPHI